MRPQPFRIRRPLLGAAVALFAALSARRAHALRDPSTLSVGGSAGAHDAHISCGPDVRVNHASGGIAYERTFEREPGVGVSMAVRGGVGSTVITGISDLDSTDASVRKKANDLAASELHKVHMLMSAQVSFGYDWRVFAIRGGVGYFGLSELKDDTQFRSHYVPLPTLDMRIGRRDGFSADLGFGSPPIAGLARWYSLHAIAQYRFKEGGEVGAGEVITFGELDERIGTVFKGSFPITPAIQLGGFGMIGVNAKSKLSGLDYTVGAHLTFVLEAFD